MPHPSQPLPPPPGPDLIEAAVRRLRVGGVVAFPTETVYGLGADALSESAVGRVFALKGRPANNPLIVHVADISAARRLVAHWPPEAQRLAERFWPGPLTIVLPKSPAVPGLVTAGGPTVAVRIPDHPLALELLRSFAGPLVGPSANPSGFISPTSAQHVRDAFDGLDLLVLDGGPCSRGIESTVLSLAGADEGPRVLRRGVISPQEIARILGSPVVEGPDLPGDATGPLPSPGLLDRHYAPRAPARLVDAFDLPDAIARAPRDSICLSHEAMRFVNTRLPILALPSDAESYAADLYRALRDADACNPALILIHRPESRGPLWDAIRDRLRRAAAPRSP